MNQELSTGRVLLVEDEDMNRTLVRAIVARSEDKRIKGLEIIEAPTLAVARTALAEGGVDIILLDARLPDGSGLDLARELAAEPGPRAWIIGFSASVLPEQRAAALMAGCDTFLGKPFHPEELRAILLEALTRADVDNDSGGAGETGSPGRGESANDEERGESAIENEEFVRAEARIAPAS